MGVQEVGWDSSDTQPAEDYACYRWERELKSSVRDRFFVRRG